MSPNSSAWPCKANRMIKSYGAGDGNRTHVRSLGSLQFNSKNAGLAAFLRFSERPNWKIMENGKRDRKSTRLNSSHQIISYAVFCLKKKTMTVFEWDFLSAYLI